MAFSLGLLQVMLVLGRVMMMGGEDDRKGENDGEWSDLYEYPPFPGNTSDIRNLMCRSSPSYKFESRCESESDTFRLAT